MAARWETVIGSGVKAWAPHRCEDYLIIDALLRLRDVEPYDKDLSALVNRYLGQGDSLSDDDVGLLNQRLDAAGMETLSLVETRPDSYCKQKGYGKANVRTAIMRTIGAMADAKRTEVMMQYRQDAKTGQRLTNGAAPDASADLTADRQPAPAPAGGASRQFELTFHQTVERVGRLIVTAPDLAAAVAEAAVVEPGRIDWTEVDRPGSARVTGVNEV